PCSRLSLPLASVAPGGQADRRTRSSYACPGCTRGGTPTSSNPPSVVLHGVLDRRVEAGVRVGHLPYEPPHQKVEVSVLLFDSRSKFGHVEAILPVLRPAGQAEPGRNASFHPNHDLVPANPLVHGSAASFFP